MARPQKFDEQEIISKAMLYFWQHGYSASSIQELLEEMKISRGTLYNSVGDKDALFKRCITCFQERVEQLLLITLFNHQLMPAQRVEQFVKLSFSSAPGFPEGCLMVNSLCEDDRVLCHIKPIVSKTLGKMEQGFCSVFEELLPDKSLAQSYASMMATQVKGARVRQREGSSSYSIIEDMLNLFELLSGSCVSK